MNTYTAIRRSSSRKLERLADYAGRRPTTSLASCIVEIQEEFQAIKRGAVREGDVKPGPLSTDDVLGFGAEVGVDRPKVRRGCEVFASVAITETIENAPYN